MRASILHREVAVLVAGLLCAGVLAAQTSPTQTHHHARPSAAHPAAPVPVEAPPPPPPPNWPINDHPAPAAVEWDGTSLRVDAANSSLQQILAAVSTAVGTKVEGFSQDQRVFGNFGPGQPQDVLTQLLHGSGYNFLLIGDQGQGGAPRQIVLSSRNSGGAASRPAAIRSTPDDNNNDDDDDNQVDTQPPPPPQLPQLQQQQPPGRPGFGPEGPVRTPQQIQQELLQRQQQILQQQQLQQGNQLQQTNPPPNQ